MPRHLPLAALCVAIVMSALSACGNDKSVKPKSEEEEVRAAATGFAASFVDEDYSRTCALMTREAKADLLQAQRVLDSSGCVDSVRKAHDFLGEEDLARVRDYQINFVSITGTRAEVDDNSEGSPTELRKIGGQWLVDKDRKRTGTEEANQ